MIRKREMAAIQKAFKTFQVVAILGPRQCGKTTLAKQIPHADRFDLESTADLARLSNPQLALGSAKGLVIIDEIQRQPQLFETIRYLVDEKPKQKFLILGSASRDLISQSSETLAGRIHYHELGPFNLSETGGNQLEKLWLRGGFPRSFLAKNDEASHVWLKDYIATFLERDVPQLGIRIPAKTLHRFWIMLSHYHGQILNYSELARSFGISDMTVRHYIDILEGTFMVRVLKPWHSNTSKRLVKAPKLFIGDSGIFHSLQNIYGKKQLASHPKLGASWEGFALEETCRILGIEREHSFFWGTQAGAELDLFWQKKGKNFGAEFKFNEAPTLTKSMRIALADLRLDQLYVVYPGKKKYQLQSNVTVIPLTNLSEE